MRNIAAIAAIIVTLLLPGLSYSEDNTTQLLAKSIYANTRGQSYETMLAYGNVIMNRVNDKQFPDTIDAVINQKHQFAYGKEYDGKSIEVARQLIKGKTILPKFILYAKSTTSKQEWSNQWFYKSIGNIQFYLSK